MRPENFKLLRLGQITLRHLNDILQPGRSFICVWYSPSVYVLLVPNWSSIGSPWCNVTRHDRDIFDQIYSPQELYSVQVFEMAFSPFYFSSPFHFLAGCLRLSKKWNYFINRLDFENFENFYPEFTRSILRGLTYFVRSQNSIFTSLSNHCHISIRRKWFQTKVSAFKV